MADLEYSLDAENAKNAFYRADAMVYVEGDDDVLFWHTVLTATTDMKFEIEQVGGAPEIEKYVSKIISGQLQAIVARDSDLRPLAGTIILHPLVIHTYGHSVENTLYTPEALHHLTRSWSKSNKISLAECEVWLDELANSCEPLLQLDLANELSGAGVQTIGDNCSRFMKSKYSCIPCKIKISTFKSNTDAQIPKTALASALAAINAKPRQVTWFLRGHFIASAVMKFIVHKAQEHGKKVSISAESLYAAALIYFGSHFNAKHPHFVH